MPSRYCRAALVAGGAAHHIQAGRAGFQDSTHVNAGVPESTHRGTQSHTVAPFVIHSAATDAILQDIFRQTSLQHRCTVNIELSACICSRH